MKTRLRCLVAVAGLFTVAAFADCEMPSLVAEIPDGARATEVELLAVQAEVTAYIAAMDRYIACENDELTAREEDATAEFLFRMSTRIESARNEVDAIATNFNDQVNAFRATRQATTIAPQPAQPGILLQ
jgi:hypothetical protein